MRQDARKGDEPRTSHVGNGRLRHNGRLIQVFVEQRQGDRRLSAPTASIFLHADAIKGMFAYRQDIHNGVPG
jgi:hypothetical protein